MDNEHFAFIIELLDFTPPEVVSFAGTLKRQDSRVVEAEVQLTPPMILGTDAG